MTIALVVDPWYVAHPRWAAVALALSVAVLVAAFVWGLFRGSVEHDIQEPYESAVSHPRTSGPVARYEERRDNGDMQRLHEDQRRRELRRRTALAQSAATKGRPRLAEHGGAAPTDPRRI